MKNIDLIILAGGKGTRIKKFLQNKPKPMMRFRKIFFLKYLINNFSKYPIKRIFILVGYRNNIIYKNFHNKFFNFVEVKCIKEDRLMGTGGALLGLKKKNVKDFILINGDTIFDVDINDLINNHKKNKIGCIALASNKKNINTRKLNELSLKKNKIILKKNSKYMNGGVYFFKKQLLNLIPHKPCSLENDILPKIIKKGLVSGKIYNDFFLDIGSPNYLKIAEKKLINYFEKPAAFLDRDGVINHDYGYVHKKKDFKLRAGVLDGLKLLIKKNYNIFIVTNQAGIAKGLFKEKDFRNLHVYLKNYFFKKEIFFNDVKFCPYHVKGKIKQFKKRSSLRKPDNGMIKQISNNWIIDRKKSFMMGDKISDKKCADKSNLDFYYAKGNFYKQIRKIINNY